VRNSHSRRSAAQETLGEAREREYRAPALTVLLGARCSPRSTYSSNSVLQQSQLHLLKVQWIQWIVPHEYSSWRSLECECRQQCRYVDSPCIAPEPPTYLHMRKALLRLKDTGIGKIGCNELVPKESFFLEFCLALYSLPSNSLRMANPLLLES